MAQLILKDVRKAYGSVPVVHGVSVDIRDGEFVTLVGPSGCGKSTLLRMIAGLEDISGGEIHIGSRLVNKVPSKDRNIAMVFQNYALYPHMTVAENMAFSLQLKKADKAEIARRTSSAASILGLEHLLDRYPRQLSGGQRQRVAMGRAIVRDPAVFLFDEPLSNLDAQLRIQMRSEIKALHERLHTTTIYVTHDQVEAMTMADRIVVMNQGRVEQVGAPLDLYDRPANRFVAGFIGSPAMNFLPAARQGDRLTIEGGFVLPMRRTDKGADSHIVVGVRPEDLIVGRGDIQAEVVMVEPTGAETHILARVGAQMITATTKDRIAPKRGETLALGMPLDKLHIFDGKTGEARRGA